MQSNSPTLKETANENAELSRLGRSAPEKVIAIDPSNTVLNGMEVCRNSFPSMFVWSFIQNNSPLYKSTSDATANCVVRTANNTITFFISSLLFCNQEFLPILFTKFPSFRMPRLAFSRSSPMMESSISVVLTLIALDFMLSFSAESFLQSSASGTISAVKSF